MRTWSERAARVALVAALWACGPTPFQTPDVGWDALVAPADGGVDADGVAMDAERPEPAGDAGVELDAAPDGAAPDDAAPADAFVDPPDAGAGTPPDAFVEGDPVYRDDRLLSPLTPRVVETLRRHMENADAQDDVFAKVGASSTVSRSFMHCFAGDGVDLDGRDPLRETIDFFGAGDAVGGDPYTRASVSAAVGWSVQSVLAGDPSPLDRELAALDPRFALIMFGTNDIERRNIDQYADKLLDLTDLLLARGVIPIFSSIMPRDDDPEADDLVASYNAVVRGVAQERMVPFTDLHQPLLSLPNHGLGPDRLHTSAFPGGACVFTDAGLMHGYNWRNLLTIETLDRLMRTLLDGDPAPDPPAPQPAPTARGRETITWLPFAALARTPAGRGGQLDAYPACDSGQDESGHEHVYFMRVEEPTPIRAWVLDRGDADIDIHLLSDPADPDTCVARDNRELRTVLEPGGWFFVLDTYVGAGEPLAGEYLFVVLRDE